MYRKKMGKVELVDRIKLIQRYCRGKKVLNVGCVGHTVPYEHPLWLHKYIREVADHVLGIDIEAGKVKELKEKGYNIYYYDDAWKWFFKIFPQFASNLILVSRSMR